MTACVDGGLLYFGLEEHDSTKTVYMGSGNMISTIMGNVTAHRIGHRPICLHSKMGVPS